MSAMFKDSDRDGVLNAFDCKPRNKHEQGLIDNMIKVFKSDPKEKKKKELLKAEKKANTRKGFAYKMGTKIARANPKYNMQMEKRVAGLQPMSKLDRKKLNLDYERMRLARVARQQLVGGGASPKANTLTRSIGMVFPQAQPRTNSGGAVGVPGQRGRPRGSFEGKYAVYGGVFGYRKAMALKKKAEKYAEQQAELQQKIQQPQYETQQYQQEQVPQETPGAIPDYAQFQQEVAANQPEVVYEQPQQVQYEPQQVVYQQPQQQYAPEPQKRDIRPVFKSSGGSPYGSRTPIVQGSLAPSNTYEDYVEYADAFTGERKWKKKPQAESWSRPKDPNQEPIIKQSWMGNR